MHQLASRLSGSTMIVRTLCVWILVASVAHAAERPNVLFILADDLGIGDLQCYGNPIVDTPALNALAARGVRLTAHYAPSPLCAPSRAGYLTGRYNHRTGAIDVPSNRGLDRLAFREKTWGDYFRHAGYSTALIGKWHNGLYCRDHLPHRRGFDRFFGFPNGGQDYWHWNLLRNDEHVAADGRYLTDAFNDEAITIIRQRAHSDRPFAIWLAHHTPHVPFQAPQDLISKYQQRLGPDGSKQVAIIYAMIEAMDRGLQRVFDALRETDQWETTMIVFTSDNGAHLGRAEGGSAMRYHASFSGNKGDVGEQGIRVPAIVSWPGQLPEGRVISTPIHGCDWLPTLFSLSGSAAPQDALPLDGANVMSLLKGEGPAGEGSAKWNRRFLPFQKNRYMPVAHSDGAIRRGPWKLVWPPVAATMRKDSARDNPSYLRGIEHPHWEMPLDRELAPAAAFTAPQPRLYHLTRDPAERRDVAEQNPELVEQLSDRYQRWFDSVMVDWKRSRKQILEHDREYWRQRTAPDPAMLFEDYWLWRHAPKGAERAGVNPLDVFPGFWNRP